MIVERTKCFLNNPRLCVLVTLSTEENKIPLLFQCWCSSSLIFRPPIFPFDILTNHYVCERTMIYANLYASLSSTLLSFFSFFFSFLLIIDIKKNAHV